MLYYDYWPCCRPKVAGVIIPVYINVFALALVLIASYMLTLDIECYKITGLLGSGNCLSRPVVILVLVWHVLEILVNMVMLLGLAQKDRRLLLPWLVWFAVLWIFCLGYAFAEFFMRDAGGGEEGEKDMSPTPMESRTIRQMWLVIIAAIFMYLWSTILDLFFRMDPSITDDRILEGKPFLAGRGGRGGEGTVDEGES